MRPECWEGASQKKSILEGRNRMCKGPEAGMNLGRMKLERRQGPAPTVFCLFFHTVSWGIYHLWLLFGGPEAQRGPGLGPGRKWEKQDSLVASTCKFSQVREYTSEKPKRWPLWSLLLLPGSRWGLSHRHQKLPGWTGSGRFVSLVGVLWGAGSHRRSFFLCFFPNMPCFHPLAACAALSAWRTSHTQRAPTSLLLFSHDPSMFLTVKLFIRSSLGADWGLDRGAAMCPLPPWPLNHTKMPQGL